MFAKRSKGNAEKTMRACVRQTGLRVVGPLEAPDQIVEQIATHVEKVLKGTVPEVEVTGDTCLYLTEEAGRDFTSALQVCIIVSIKPDLLLKLDDSKQHIEADSKKKQWRMINTVTELLVVHEAGFRLGRKLFNKSVPNALILAPPSFQASGQELPIQLFVNCASHLQRLGLIHACKKIEPRAKKLILLVERWAKQRGVCSAGGGDLTPLVWTLLAVYFLQVGVPHQPLLPPLQGLKSTNAHFKFSASGDTTQWKVPVEGHANPMSVGGLFKTFFEFYAERFDWHNGVISIRLGVRHAHTPNLPRQVKINADGSSTVGPCVEDPYDPSRNLTANVTSRCMPQLHEELQRSMQILGNRGSLSNLLTSVQPLVRA